MVTTPRYLELLFGIFQIVFEVMQQNCMRRAALLSQTLDIVRRYRLSETQGGKISPLRPFVQSRERSNQCVSQISYLHKAEKPR